MDSEKWVKAIESYLHRDTLFVVFVVIHKDAENMVSYSKYCDKKTHWNVCGLEGREPRP